MLEIRFHGRGGQGAVTAAVLLAAAAFHEGKFAQAFPMFGVERRGAPVEAFARISESFIRRRCGVYEPDVVVVLDSTLFGVVDVMKGLKRGGKVVVNTKRKSEDFGVEHEVYTVDASHFALQVLGVDIVNTAMLAAVSAFTRVVGIESIKRAIEEHFPKPIAEKNLKLVDEVYERCEKG